MIFMLTSCYIVSFAQSNTDNQDGNAGNQEYYGDEYIEEEDYSRMRFVELKLHLRQHTAALERKIDGVYFGFGADYLFQLDSDQPGFIGVGLDYTYLENASLTTFDPKDGFPFDFNTTTSFGYWSVLYRHYLGLRFLGLEPFVEGKLGLAAMWTSTSVTSSDDPEFSEFDFNNFDTSVGYCFSFGLNYAVADAIFITTKVGYLSALSTEYDVHDGDNIAEASSYDYFSRKSSTIDVIRYDLGVTFAF